MSEASWCQSLLREAEAALSAGGKPVVSMSSNVGIHLGIFVEPYLQFVLEGRKTIESRFGVQRCAPHGRVARGDILLLKRVSGPVIAACAIGETWFFDLREVDIHSVRDRFARPLCAEDALFWSQRAHATLATLMTIEHVVPLDPITVEKRDRRGWVTLRPAASLSAAAPG